MFDYLKAEGLSRKTRRRLIRNQLEKQHAVNNIMAGVALATTDSSRGPSDAIWSSCPWSTLTSNPSYGMTFWDDFLMTGNAVMSSAYAASIGQWSAYGYAGATITDAQLEGGVVNLQSDGDNEGLTLLSSTGAFRMVTTSTLALNQKLWFEARFAKSSITTATVDCFVGLMKPTLASGLPAAAQPITTTDDTLMTAGDLFGFHLVGTTATRGGPTEIENAFVLTSGTVNFPTNLTTMMASSGNSVLTAAGYVKVGFIFDPNGPRKTVTAATARQTAGTIRKAIIRFFINGREHPTFLTTEDVANATATQAFPTAFMAPVFSVMNMAGSSPGYLSCDWIRVAQLANT